MIKILMDILIPMYLKSCNKKKIKQENKKRRKPSC